MKFGLIVDSGNLKYLPWKTIEFLRKKYSNSDVRVIIQKKYYLDKPNVKPSSKISIANLLWNLWIQKEKHAVSKYAIFQDIFITKEVSEFQIDLTEVYVDYLASTNTVFYSEDNVNQITKTGIDTFIYFATGIVKGHILNNPNCQIIGIHHGDNRYYRGRPPGFWECKTQEPSIGFVIQRYTESLDGGDTIMRGNIPNLGEYIANRAHLLAASLEALTMALDGLIQHRHSCSEPGVKIYSQALYKLPSRKDKWDYCFRRSINILRSKSWPRKNPIWKISFKFTERWDNAALYNSCQLNTPPGRFYADPFAIFYQNQYAIFFEDYCIKNKKGSISAVLINKNTNQVRLFENVLEEPFHLSFPYIFEVNGRLYMLPETNNAGDIRLYICENFPTRWRLYKTLITDIRASDTILKYHDNRWYLFTNPARSGTNDFNSELHVFCADQFDSPQWASINRNFPVKIDSGSARNAGSILTSESGKLYRPYQIPGFNHYGLAVGFAEITSLSTSCYCEQLSYRLEAEYDETATGVHHFSFCAGLLAFDTRYH